MRLPLHFDADLITFLDRAYSAASIAAPGVAVHERIANLRRALHEQYHYRLLEVDATERVYCLKYGSCSICAPWTRWGRMARGASVHLLESGRFIVLKRLLDRGAEMLLKVHLQADIFATQDVPWGAGLRQVVP